MGRAERSEYLGLIHEGVWTVASVRRLHELRKWRDVRSELIPPEFRTKPREDPVSEPDDLRPE